MGYKFLYVGILTLLGYFACKDFFYRRVDNQVALASLLAGLLVSLLHVDPLADSVSDWLMASVMMLCFALVFYLLGFFAAGDAKFAAVIGGLLGLSVQLLFVIFLSNFFVFFHALINRLNNFFRAGDGLKKSCSIPYAGYMALSTMIVIAYYMI